MAAVDDLLAELQTTIRAPNSDEPGRTFISGKVPDDLATETVRTIGLFGPEALVVEELRLALIDDLRFEYMDRREREDATWRFVCLAALREHEDHIPDFIAEHAREIERLTCFYPVIHMTVAEEVTFAGARLIPADEAQLPGLMSARDPAPTVDSVIGVECEGSDRGRMSERAADAAGHVLRVLRAGLPGLASQRFLNDRQLRFRLGEQYWFSDGLSGWRLDPGAGRDYPLAAQTVREIGTVSVGGLPALGSTEIERCALRALRWFEQSQSLGRSADDDPSAHVRVGDDPRSKRREVEGTRLGASAGDPGAHDDRLVLPPVPHVRGLRQGAICRRARRRTAAS